jgi:hypothetical protein
MTVKATADFMFGWGEFHIVDRLLRRRSGKTEAEDECSQKVFGHAPKYVIFSDPGNHLLLEAVCFYVRFSVAISHSDFIDSRQSFVFLLHQHTTGSNAQRGLLQRRFGKVENGDGFPRAVADDTLFNKL